MVLGKDRPRFYLVFRPFHRPTGFNLALLQCEMIGILKRLKVQFYCVKVSLMTREEGGGWYGGQAGGALTLVIAQNSGDQGAPGSDTTAAGPTTCFPHSGSGGRHTYITYRLHTEQSNTQQGTKIV